MKIAIDCRPAAPGSGYPAGIGRYAAELTRHLLKLDEEDRYVLLFDDAAKKSAVADIVGAARNVEIVRLKVSRGRRLLPVAYSHGLVAKAVAAKAPDVLHATTGSLPLGYRGRSVITVHDLAIYLHPEWFPGGQFFSRRLVVPKSVRTADRVIAVSHSTKRDLLKVFAVPPEKIAVIHEGVEHHLPFSELSAMKEPVLKRRELGRPYFLFLGTVEPRKNVDGLVRAFAALAKSFPGLASGVDLVLAGAEGWKAGAALREMEKANDALEKAGIDARVRRLGRVSEEERLVLMAESVAFVFPTWYEGFGLPVLEAMSLGVPVIASNVSSIPEIAGHDGALLVDPGDAGELVLAMKHLLEDPDKRAALGRRGMLRSTEFRWEKAAGETLEIYEEAARGGRAAHAPANLRAKWMDETLFGTPHRPL